jgi:hypothetical protein
MTAYWRRGLLVLLLLTGGCAIVTGGRNLLAGDPPAPGVRAVPLDRANPERNSVGRLHWLGGLEIDSRDPRFGGYSALEVTAEGRECLALSDRGDWIRLAPHYGREGELSGVSILEFGSLALEAGAPSREKSDRDAEGLAVLPDGRWLVSFEGRHRILVYPSGPEGLARTPEVWPWPNSLQDLPFNRGLEALAALPDGRVLAFLESDGDGPEGRVFLWQDQDWHGLTLAPSGSLRPTGAALLPDGDLLLLQRGFSFFSGLRARLLRIPQEQIQPGAELRGEVLADLAPPLTVDNFEGVTAWRDAQGRTLIALISDDNTSALQRTLLVLFASQE